MGTSERYMFEPDWTSHPTETLIECMEVLQYTPEILSRESGLNIDTVRGILDKEIFIDYDIALGLSKSVGGPPSFWINRQINYLQSCKRLNLEP